MITFRCYRKTSIFFAVFSALWRELGGTIQGKPRAGIAPADQIPFAKYVLPPLSEVIRDINKFSNNIMARQLFLALGTVALDMDVANSSNEISKLTLIDGKGASEKIANQPASNLLAGKEGGNSAENELSGQSTMPGSQAGSCRDHEVNRPPANITRSTAAM